MTLPARMTAIVIRAPGGPEMLVPEQRPMPEPGPGEVLIRVESAGICGTDRGAIHGLEPYPTPGVLGHEGCGIVEAVVGSLRADKNMRWADPELTYSRPVRWLVALWGADLVPAIGKSGMAMLAWAVATAAGLAIAALLAR